jgi:hypothetical protein
MPTIRFLAAGIGTETGVIAFCVQEWLAALMAAVRVFFPCGQLFFSVSMSPFFVTSNYSFLFALGRAGLWGSGVR